MPNRNAIAIVGMAGRLPQSPDLESFWEHLRNGAECISRFSDADLEASGVDPAIARDPHYVNAAGVVDGEDMFDARFFGFSPREAEIMDPQHRLFLECAWQTFENAGCDPSRTDARIGVFAGCSRSTYLQNIYSHPELIQAIGEYDVIMANEKDHLATRVAYKLDLRGPAVTVQTTCSTSLVAICMAAEQLLSGECDMALAGGVSVLVPQRVGYVFRQGGILSPDGHCRAFSHDASGIVGGNGVGTVLLKPLGLAVANRDHIRAVIRGWATNNDGARKVGYTAPSVAGQARVIAEAHDRAGLPPVTIRYVEAHGTGTQVGDPIEVTALTQAFRRATNKKQFCALGSVKTNIGHLDPAAGVAGVIKTVLALEHEVLPPSLNFAGPNPLIDFADTPFFVNTEVRPWPGTGPRRAGVSSFGIGGTNSHVVLESAPPVRATRRAPSPPHLLVQSANSPEALDAASVRLASHLRARPELALADVAWTLQMGRRAFKHRRISVCECDSAAEAADALEGRSPGAETSSLDGSSAVIAFMFPGQGAQQVAMGAGLYRRFPVFRQWIDDLCDAFVAETAHDLRPLLIGDAAPDTDEAAELLARTDVTQPALFATEYALAKLLTSWGVEAQALLGHSVGEIVAACLAGVFSLDDAVRLIARRGRLIQELPAGAMLAVSMTLDEVAPLCEELDVAAVNGPQQCVLSGPERLIEDLEQALAGRTFTARLQTSRAFHSKMVAPAAQELEAFVSGIALHPPQLPFPSNVTGTWAQTEEVTDPAYWGAQLRSTVQFDAGLTQLLGVANCLVEVGPGRTLSTLAQTHAAARIFSCLPNPLDRCSQAAQLMRVLGQLWLNGVECDWARLNDDGSARKKIPLPTYPFERRRFWVDRQHAAPHSPMSQDGRHDVGRWMYVPLWKTTPPLTPHPEGLRRAGCWLVLYDERTLGAELANRLEQEGCSVVRTTAGTEYLSLSPGHYQVRPDAVDDYVDLLTDLANKNVRVDAIVHAWGVVTAGQGSGRTSALTRGFYSVLALAKARKRAGLDESVELNIVTTRVHAVIPADRPVAEKAAVLGPVRVIPQEHPRTPCRSIDLDPGPTRAVLNALLAELSGTAEQGVVALRRGVRYVQDFVHVTPDDMPKTPAVQLPPESVHLITGGLGGIGLVLAEFLAATARARLALIARTAFPPRTSWDRWLHEHDENDQVAKTILTIRRMEQLGAKVMVLRGDVTDIRRMKAVIRHVTVRFGPVHGVIHAAGISGGGVIDGRSADAVAEVMAPKVEGTMALLSALSGQRPNYILLCSSLASVLGGLGRVDYSAANAVLDAVAYRHRERSGRGWTHVISVNWDGWRDVGMSVKTDLAPAFRQRMEQEQANAIGPNEGMEAFSRALWLGAPQILVSTTEPRERSRSPLDRHNAATAMTRPSTPAVKTYARPTLDTPFVPPEGEVEEAVAAIWRELLGLDLIGRNDNFFELGGHSLLAVQVTARLRDIFLVDLPITTLFEAPSVAELSEVISRSQEVEDLGPLLDELDRLRSEGASSDQLHSPT